ncbi:MAG: hypothetical protein GY765_17285, partial [bacterium]|nr:hypothetical protein [bacterium]
ELDEHDSDGGYLTRIEAFLDVVNAFMSRQKQARSIRSQEQKQSSPRGMPFFSAYRKPDFRGIVWFPRMHYYGTGFLAAALRAHGYDARPLPPEDRESFELGKKYLKGGECLPMAATLGTFLKQVKNHSHDTRHIIFTPTTEGPCRFGQYNLLQRVVFHELGLTNVDIMSPSSLNGYQGVGDAVRKGIMHGVLCADLLLKLTTKTRPYERSKGDTDALTEEAAKRLELALEKRENPRLVFKELAPRFAAIPKYEEKKPLVGVVGEIYVRCNDFSNGNLISVIEKNGGEAWLSPVQEWLLYLAYIQSAVEKGGRFNPVKKSEAFLTNLYLNKLEQSYINSAGNLLADRHEPPIKKVVEAGAEFLPLEFVGEAILTLGRAIHFAHQGADMVINAAPFGCMPGTLSSSILLEIKERYNIPFVSLFYDGDIDGNEKIGSLLSTLPTREKVAVKAMARSRATTFSK